MRTIFWHFKAIPKSLCLSVRNFYQKCKITFQSLTYNHFMDQSYAADVCMGPMFWIVDNFTTTIGTLLVFSVVSLTASVVIIAYWIGIPYWWERNYLMCIFLIVVGHWLLINICFHYYMAVFTHPGLPPEGELIFEAVSICKKCIAPKPPRTHHCSVCNRCILKMDHHCPWLNNCVGYKNHRYFFLYMVYMVAGVLFVILAGFDIAYLIIMEPVEPELVGHSVKFNQTAGSLIPITVEPPNLEDSSETANLWRRKAVIYMALINVGVFLALGALASWHAQLITRGETSIEANINKTETKRLAELDKKYTNPYNFGSRKNWRLFLGLFENRSFIRHILLPSTHAPEGNGLTWRTATEDLDEWP